ncbi:hypothetical protein ABZV91_08620 [Nocardia sp. NPDC004568]|uniref:hypothetical protein n=1 Tax=Nocardia sp. NPDC004568 TaxID=3154551 RepID=UPI0033B1A205
MATKTNARRLRRTLTIFFAGLALAVTGTPAASALPGHPAPAGVAATPIDSGSSSGSGYLLEAVLNALCALTGSKPTCWSDAPTL